MEFSARRSVASAKPLDGQAADTLLYHSERTRVFRRKLTDGTSIVCKEALGPKAAERMRHERRILERLQNIAGVPRFASHPPLPGLLVLKDDGNVSLAELLRDKALTAPDLLSIALQLTQTLAAVHRAGVIHKDINPSNVLLRGTDRRPLLIDYDLATTFAEERPGFIPASEIAGTLAYLAPEQTGRTGRAVDQRADLYALGATLYELATGRPPFAASDPFQVIHDHLALTPEAPNRVDNRVPQGLSDIVLRLLEKEPDERYQSAEGLAHDLTQLRELLARGARSEFPLGTRDFPLRLTPPSRLAGRRDEVRALRTAFDRSMTGAAGVMVSGAPGVGKSALIDELRAMVGARRGWFISGKFDQYRQDSATTGLTQALRALAHLLLSEPEAELEAQRQRILEALGPNAGLLQMPEFTMLLGTGQQAMPEDVEEATTRLRQAGIDLLRAVASPERPLVLVLEDLQWAGPGVTEFINALLTAENLRGLLLVGSYRESELDPAHPLNVAMQRWQRLGLAPLHLKLNNLETEDLTHLLAEMLRLPEAAARQLAEVVGERTGGNPYDTVELVNALRREGVLKPDEAGWAWDEKAIRRHIGAGDVVDLLTVRLARLPPRTRELLQISACLGGTIESPLLQTASDLPESELESRLEPALEDGLLVMERAEHSYRFRHDRVQQAAHDLSDDHRRTELRLSIARRLVRLPEFEAFGAQQYLAAVHAIGDREERQYVIHLLHRCAHTARAITDYAACDRYLSAAQELLKGLPIADAPLAVTLNVERHAVLYSLGRFEEADQIYPCIELDCRDELKLIAAARVQVCSLTNRGRPRDALDLGFAMLARLGFPVPEQDLAAEIDRRMREFYRWAEEDIERADQRPEIEDPRMIAAATLINALTPPANHSDLRFFAWLVLESQRLWMSHGPCPALALSLAGTPFVTMSLRDDYRTGYIVARHIHAVAEARNWRQVLPQIRFAFYGTAAHWFESVGHCSGQVQIARDELLRDGNVQMACFTYNASIPLLLESAPTLDACTAEMDVGCALAARSANDYAMALFTQYGQFLRPLRGEAGFAADVGAEEARLAGFPTAAAIFHISRALCAAVFGETQTLIHHAAAAIPLLPYTLTLPPVAMAYMLQALALCQRLQARANAAERSALLAELGTVRAWLAQRADEAPGNFAHILRWIDAERIAAQGEVLPALAAFDLALNETEAQRHPWHGALVAERAGRFHLAHRFEHAGRTLLHQARQQYATWGADAKVRRLIGEFPFLRAAAAPPPSDRAGSSSGVSRDSIDLLGVLRASQVLSSETDLARLAVRLAEVLRDMTGATEVHLVLRDDDAQSWRVVNGNAESASLEDTGHQGQIPLSALRYAQRTRAPVLVEDALRDDRFARDPCFAGIELCSLLVVPIMSQGMMRAILMLENRLSRGAFTADRLDAVMLIAGQLAVSLENALVYASLERKVAERTEDLKAANLRLEALSSTDPLTGLANRRRFNEAIETEWQRAQRPRTPIALAMIDVDFFKLYNDHYGHLDGDECLRRVALALNESVRIGADLAARYGGEEFVILLPETTLDAARTVAERARSAIEAMQLSHPKSPLGSVTVSIGVAAIVPSADSRSEQLTALADAALYEAKRNGRNRVFVRMPGDEVVLAPMPEQGSESLQSVPDTAPDEAIDAASPMPLRVLLIEDSETDAGLITRQLRRNLKDVSIECVQTAEALDAALAQKEWDVVVCDYYLPALGALPALARVRRLKRYLPFIIVSGAIREDTAVEAMKLGADDYVMKDNLARLVPAVKREIEASETRRKRAEADQALLDSLELYRSLADAMPMGMYRIDDEGRVLFMNAYMRAATGLTDPAQYLGMPIYSVGAETDRKALDRSKETDRQVMDSGASLVTTEEFLTAGTGSRHWLEITRVPVRDHEGKVIGLQGVIRDVTDEHRHKKELAFERQLLSMLMDNIPDMIYFKDPELRYIRINKALARRYGLENPQDAIGKRASDFLNDNSARRGEQDEMEILRTGDARLGVEDHLAIPDGRTLWFLRTEVPIRGAGGEITGLVAVSRDITERKAVQQKLVESEELFRQISENIRDVFYLIDLKNGQLLYISPAYEEIYARSRESLYAAPKSWTETIHREDRARVLKLYRMDHGARFDCQFRILRPDGSMRWVHSRGYPILDQSGEPYRFVAVSSDITEQKDAERQLQQLSRVQAVLSGINALIVRVTDREELLREACRIAVQAGQFLSAHIAMIDEALGLRLAASSETEADRLERLQNVLTRSMTDPSTQDFRDSLLRRCEPRVVGNIAREVAEAHKANFERLGAYSLASLPLVVAGRAIGVFVLYAREPEFFDAEEMKLLKELAGDIAFALDHLDKAEKLDYLAYYDQVTGLANAHLCREHLDQYIRAAQSRKSGVALTLLDVEHFKTFNDALGRPTGDELLKQVGQRLVAWSGNKGMVARLGADHFALVLPDVSNADEVAHIVARHYPLCFGEPFLIGGAEFKVAANIGIAMYPHDGGDADTLFRNAEAALKKAKAGAERYLFYTQQMTERVAEKLTLENKLRRAVDNEEFVLHYQPKVATASGHIVGVEALIRWNDPEGAMIPPLDFVPILEATGLILEVGAWALRRAVQDRVRWKAEGLDAPRVAVNVSAIQLRRGDFVDAVAQAIAVEGGAPGIDLEITESLIMQDIEDTIGKLKAIRDMGVHIAIDDFGTGYSSLAYLSRLPVSTVKIDRSFIITMLRDQNTMTMVSTIISLAHSLGLQVVAEGVDEEAQADVLRRLGCDEMQGYLYRKPAPAEDIAKLIRRG